MAIVSVNEHWNERSASDNKEGVRDFSRSYIVVVDSPTDGQASILADPRIPAKYSIYATDTETDLGARVVSREAKQEGEGYFVWMVTVKYSSKWYDAAKADENPLLRPAVNSWSSKDFQVPFTEDLDGDAVVNASKESFDPPIMKDVGRLVLTVEKNVAIVSPTQILEYLHSVNDSDFRGFPAGQAKLMRASFAEQYEGEQVYDKLRLEFEFNEDGWENISVLNQGYMELDPNDLTKFRMITDRSGNPVSRPRLLDEEGDQLDLATQDPVFLSFRAYPRKDFSQLGI
jgi:hypothetical protein